MAAVAAAVGASVNPRLSRMRPSVHENARNRQRITDDFGNMSVNSRDTHMSYRPWNRNSGPLRRGDTAELRRGASASELRPMEIPANPSNTLIRWMEAELKSQLEVIDVKLEKLLQVHMMAPNSRPVNLGISNRRCVQKLSPLYPSISPRARAALATASGSSALAGCTAIDHQKHAADNQPPTPSERSDTSDNEGLDRKPSKNSSDGKSTSRERKVSLEQKEYDTYSAPDTLESPSFMTDDYEDNDLALEPEILRRQASGDGKEVLTSSHICESFQDMLNMNPHGYRNSAQRFSGGDRQTSVGLASSTFVSKVGTIKVSETKSETRFSDSITSNQRGSSANSTESFERENNISPTRSVRSMKSAVSSAADQLNRTTRVARQVLLAGDTENSMVAEMYSTGMCTFLLLSVPFSLMQTYANSPLHGWWAAGVETSIDVIFLLEFIMRFYLSPSRRIFISNQNNIIDLFASLPPLVVRIAVGFTLPQEPNDTPQNIFLLGWVPVLRLLKTIRHLKKFHLLIMSCRLALEALPTLLFALLVLTLFFAPLIFMVESRENIPSLPKAIWLTLVTMTTVGYGDTTPKSIAGTIIVGILVISSVLFMAMPLGIIGQAFNEIWQDRDRILLARGTRERLVSWGYTAQDIPRLFEGYGDGSGELMMQEFRDMIKKLQIGLSDERTIELFNSFDEDGSGSIDAQEFTRLLFPNDYYRMYGKG